MKRRPKVPPTPDKPENGELPLGGLGLASVQLPLVQLSLENTRVEVRTQGDKKVLVIGPVALIIGLPFDTDAAKHIGGLLASGLEIPSGVVIERVGETRQG